MSEECKTRRPKTNTKLVLEQFQVGEPFPTSSFLERMNAGATLPAAIRSLKGFEEKGMVRKIESDRWVRIEVDGKGLLKKDVLLITEAMNLIQKLMEENRWLKAEVERWAGVAKQAKVYFNREGE